MRNTYFSKNLPISAVWLQFGQNPEGKTCLHWFWLHFPQKVTKSLKFSKTGKFLATEKKQF